MDASDEFLPPCFIGGSPTRFDNIRREVLSLFTRWLRFLLFEREKQRRQLDGGRASQRDKKKRKKRERGRVNGSLIARTVRAGVQWRIGSFLKADRSSPPLSQQLTCVAVWMHNVLMDCSYKSLGFFGRSRRSRKLNATSVPTDWFLFLLSADNIE